MKKQKQTLIERQVKSRLSFLLRVIEFVKEVLPEVGRIIHHHQGRYHTNSVFKLVNCRSFTFKFDRCHSEMGGNDIQIWFSEYSITDPALSIYWQTDPEDVDVRLFYDNPVWQKRLKAVLSDKKRIVARLKKRKNSKQLPTVQDKEIENTRRIIKIAKRLALVSD